MNIQVTKRDGNTEDLDLDKLHKVVFYACEGITGVSPSEVEIRSNVQFYDGIPSVDIQETLIKSAADLISEETPGYQHVGGRLINYHLRKMVYGQFEPWHIKKLVQRNVDIGFYDKDLLDSYDEDEWSTINDFIKHDRDEDLTYAAMEQFRGKYLVKNRVTNEIYETPQMAYALISATLFASYDRDIRMQYVKDYYDAISTFDISLPTPVMAGVRTPQRQFSSCVLIETADSLDSINATTSSIHMYPESGIRFEQDPSHWDPPTRNGDVTLGASRYKCCNSHRMVKEWLTLYYPIWHYEIEDLLVLKNNKGTEDNRVRHMDYGVQFNKLFYERLISGGNITLFSPPDVPGLYDAFFADQDKFKELYETAERKTSIRKKSIPASVLFASFMEERKNTGRIYLQNVDHANEHSSFKTDIAPIRQSNLCCEIDLPTKPLNDFNDEEGEIALCTLSAVNWGNIRKPEDFKKPCELAVRGLDALLTYQDYPVKAAQASTMKRRPLGIGIINLAYFLAKNDTNYSNPNLDLIDEYAEAWSYYLIKASADLAIEQGACPGTNETKYGDGITPNQTYKKDVDDLVAHTERMDWTGLRKQLSETGIRNSTLMALMPSETSAQISNATNGVEPPRAFVSVKQSKDGVLKQVVPGFYRYKNKYELLWDQKSPEGYIKIMAVLQKYIDQGISVNTSYNPQHFEEEKIPMSTMLQHLLMAYKYGTKQLYYFNTFDGSGDDLGERVDTVNLAIPDDAEIVEEDCEACTI